jgi:uncharacterized protein YxjI
MSEAFLAAERFAVTQRLTMMVNRYEVRALRDGVPGELFAMAQQKRMALRESVTFYADEARRQPVFGFRADRKLDIGATYAVTDGSGRAIGSFRKDFARSLLRSTWHLDQPGMGSVTGHERNFAVAVLRRIWDFIPVLSSVPFVWPLHFDFSADNGTPVLSVERGVSLRDRYVVTVHNPALDRRLAAAVAVGLDALMSR